MHNPVNLVKFNYSGQIGLNKDLQAKYSDQCTVVSRYFNQCSAVYYYLNTTNSLN